MDSTGKKEIIRDISILISLWKLGNYNIPDLLIEPLYLQALKKNSVLSLKAHIKRKIYFFVASLVKSIKVKKFTNKKCDVILVAGTIAHVRQLEPIAKEFRKKNIHSYWIVTKQKIAAELTSRGEDSLLIKGWSAANRAQVGINRKYTSGLLHVAGIDIARKKIWHRHLYDYLAETLGLIDIFELVILNLNPRALLVGNDLTLEGRIASSVFRRAGLFTACVQHGEVSGLLDAFHTVETFFAYGTKAASSLTKINSNTRFIVSGAPYLDSVNIEKGIDVLIAEKLSINELYILVAFSGSGNNTSAAHHRMQVESVYRIALRYPNVKIIIKLHPKDQIAYYQSPLNIEMLANVKIVKFGQPGLPQSIFDWLRGCRILITGASTVAIEAMSLEIPVVSLDYSNEYAGIEFIAENTTVQVRDMNKLLLIMDELLINPEIHQPTITRAAEYARHYFYRDSESTATQRIVTEVMQKIYGT